MSAPAGRASGLFDWRISVADVDASGEFSPFPSVDRVIVLVEGPTLVMTVGGNTCELTRSEPFAFDGGRRGVLRAPARPDP